MRCLVGIDDTDSPRGLCTTYLAYRIAVDLRPDVEVLCYPRLVRLNPNVPFKTRGNAAVCLKIEAADPESAFTLLASKVDELSDAEGGANPAMTFLEDPARAHKFEPLYLQALAGIVSPHKVRRILDEERVRRFEAGNGMGVVGAASALAFDEHFDHTYELISYRRRENWGVRREIDSSSVTEMDRQTFPSTFNNYDYQKRKVLIAPHGPDPVFAGVRGDSPKSVVRAFSLLRYDERLEGHMVFISNQHTDAHLKNKLEWKVYSSGWMDCKVKRVDVRQGGHAYFTADCDGTERLVAAYEPTGDLKRTVARLSSGDEVRAYGGVRRPSSLHPRILNMERMDIKRLGQKRGGLVLGTYIASPRANRHLTKPLCRYGREVYGVQPEAEGWLSVPARPRRVPTGISF